MKNRGHVGIALVLALATFFVASLSLSRNKGSNNYYKKFQADAPGKENPGGTTPPPPSSAAAGGLHCRAGGLKIGTYYNQEARWADGYSTVAVKELKDGSTETVACTSVLPPLLNEFNKPVKEGSITVVCNAGVLKVQGSNCLGDDNSAELEAARLAAIKAEQDRIAAEQAAAAPCPQNCNGGTGRNTFGSSGKNGNQYTVSWQACNSGHKIVRSSGNRNAYAVGACYNRIPK